MTASNPAAGGASAPPDGYAALRGRSPTRGNPISTTSADTNAAEFYAATFPDSHLGKAQSAASDYSRGAEGHSLLVEFTVLGQSFVGLNGGPGFSPNESVSFQVTTEDQPETDLYWDAIIGSGGREGNCGWCKDRWGFSWQIVPRVLMTALGESDRAVAKRVMDTLLTMRRIDIARIEAAWRG